MCGISGILSKYKMVDSAIINSLKSIKHRGPNDTIHASYFNEQIHFYSNELSNEQTQLDLIKSNGIDSNNWIGFNRLSILDLSRNGMQPFYDAETKTAFMMNGEIYNYKELRQEFLEDAEFVSDSDSEVAFQLYLKLGDNFVHHLRGMFVFVLLDYTKNQIKIWRDRFGIKPLYYFLDDENFIFSSEIAGIFATNLVKKEINFEHLAHTYYLSTNFSPNTIYHNIWSIEPATKLTVDLKNFKSTKETYWKLDYQPTEKSITKEEFLGDTQELVKLASVADVKQAVMLSGGLDSGLLAYQFGKNKTEIDALTIYNDLFDEQNELEFAKSNARNANLFLQAFEIENKVDLSTIKEYSLAEEEPNTGPEPAYFLSRKAKEKGYIILHNALGFDELFYGYNYFIQAKNLDKIPSFSRPFLKVLLKGNRKRKYEEILKYGIEALPFISRSNSNWKEIKELFKGLGSENWEHPIVEILRKVKQSNPSFEKYPLLKKLSYLDFYFYIGSHHSVRSDLPAMKNEVEMRFPFLDHLFVQKYFNCSDLDKELSEINNKPFLRKNVQNILPKDVLNMPKKGFSMFAKSWLSNIDISADIPELKDFFGDNISDDWLNDSTKKWLLISTSFILKNEK
ncbi:asparagine synthase (glutamine-hydrolyzing) [Empedobacter brevis]|uniref:asparagine synthase (glutamine-hydrolyzing) n=1 Tax=Empedobacter brevis TaxID=247 RepID=UPI002FE2EEB5